MKDFEKAIEPFIEENKGKVIVKTSQHRTIQIGKPKTPNGYIPTPVIGPDGTRYKSVAEAANCVGKTKAYIYYLINAGKWKYEE